MEDEARCRAATGWLQVLAVIRVHRTCKTQDAHTASHSEETVWTASIHSDRSGGQLRHLCVDLVPSCTGDRSVLMTLPLYRYACACVICHCSVTLM